ncbi:MAG: M81 family metallopeptidase [Nitriliruptoraceae bacterium]
MRIGFALVSQESNSFNPVLTSMDHFDVYGRYFGADVLAHADHARPVQGFIDGIGATGIDVEIVPIMKTTALSGGPLAAEVLESFTRDLSDGLAAAGELDGVGLLLHGACVAEDDDDVEGHLLEAVRSRIGDRLPIVVGLDHHANVTTRMMTHASAVIGHRTQPHDTYDTGRLTADLIVRVVADGLNPTVAWRKLRLLSHQEQFLTAVEPMKIWFDLAREMEQRPGVLSVSTFPMQPWLDVAEGGWSAVVVTDGNEPLARALADELAELAWSLREEFQVTSSVSPAAAVARAAEVVADGGFVVISDTGDSVRGGAGGDSNVVLSELLNAGAPSTLLTIVDEPAVDAARAAGIGSEITVKVGGQVTGWFEPIDVTGIVRAFEPDPVIYPDDGFALGEVKAGPTVVMDAGNVTLLLTTRQGIAGNHPMQYTHFGIDPGDYGAVVLKTASNFQHFRHMTTEVVRADTPGPSQSHLQSLPWTRIPRPIYPLDEIADWRG